MHVGLEDSELAVQNQQLQISLLGFALGRVAMRLQLGDGSPQNHAAQVLLLQLDLQLRYVLQQVPCTCQIKFKSN